MVLMGMFRGEGHLKEIHAANEKFGGFLDIFARLHPEEQKEILERINELRIEAGDNKEGFERRVKALAAMYGAVVEIGTEEEKPEKRQQFLVARIEEMHGAAEALRNASEGVAGYGK